MRRLFFFASLFLSSFALAQTETMPAPDPIDFDEQGEHIYKAMDVFGDVGTMVYNGTRSSASEFPAMGWIGNCTATAVAKNVIFTASHCVTNGKRVSFQHRGSGHDAYTATCYRHPRYNTRTVYNDYALCVLDRSLPDGSVIASFRPETPANGSDVLMNGYGRPNLVNHYWGRGSVRQTSSQDIITCGPANLGSGDSGGALLSWTDDRTGASGFYIVGVNSRASSSCSYFNRVSHTEFTEWAASFEDQRGVKICGIGIVCDGSDDDDDDGHEDPELPDCRAKLAAVEAALDELKQCVQQ